MAKAKFEFDLDNPEDKASFLKCVDADNMANFIFDLSYNFKGRTLSEYRDESEKRSFEPEDVFDFIMSKIGKSLEENNVNLENISNL